jgi:hypothetical protein
VATALCRRDENSKRAASEIEAALRTAGFSRTRAETLQLDPLVACVIAVAGRD